MEAEKILVPGIERNIDDWTNLAWHTSGDKGRAAPYAMICIAGLVFGDEASSVRPCQCVAKYYLGRTTSILGKNADLTATVGAVSDADEVLLIDIQIETAPIGHHCNQVGLTQFGFDRGTGSRIEDLDGIVIVIAFEGILSFPVDGKGIKRAIVGIGSKDNTSLEHRSSTANHPTKR